MNVAAFWDIAPCSPYVNRRFRGTITYIFRVKNQPSKTPAGRRWLGRISNSGGIKLNYVA
jgi:hypothetical protein